MSFLDGVYEFFTGRDPKAADVYADFDRVADLTDRISKISKNDVDDAKMAIQEAVRAINNVNGFQQYVGTIPETQFDSTLDTVATAISEVGKAVTKAADDIKAYEESSWWEKAGSTVVMAFAKAGEGALSVLEDIGDGVVSLGGWVAGGLGFEDAANAAADFVEKDWSHDAFNFYYESDFAKASAFTEDSAIAGAFEIAGSTAGYLALGGAISGAAGVAANSTKAGKALKAAGTFLSSTTRTNTATAFLSGVGSGTEAGLKSGMNLDEAITNGGLQQGVVQGGVAFVGGKLGERAAKKNAIEQFSTTKKGTISTKGNLTADTVKSQIDDMGINATQKEALKSSIDDITGTSGKVSRKNLLNLMEEQKLNTFQGYSDGVTKAGQKGGEIFAHSIAHPAVTAKAAGTTLAAGAGNGLKAAGSGLQKAGDAVTNLPTTLKNAPSNIKAAASTARTTIGTAASNVKTAVGSTVKGVVQHPVQTAGNILKTAGKAAVAVPKAALNNPAQTAAALNAAGRTLVSDAGDIAAEHFANDVTVDAPETVYPQETTAPQEQTQNTSTGDSSDTSGGTNTSSGGGSSSGNTGGSTGGGGSNGGGSSSTQFRQQTPSSSTSSTPSPTPTPSPSTSTPTVSTPEVETPSDTTTETPSDTTPVEEPDTNPGMSDDVTTGEEPVEETPPADTSEGVADNIGNIVNNSGPSKAPTGNTNTSNVSGSIVGGFNSSSQNKPVGPDATLSPEDEITSVTEEEPSGTLEDITGTSEINRGNSLDVISIDKETATPNIKSNSGGSVIPAVLGVGVAGAAGVAGIHYIQKKNKSEDEEYYDDESDENQNESFLSNYNAQNIDTIDDYNAQQAEETPKYKAGSMNELSLDDGADVNFDDGNSIVAPQKEELE